MVWPNASTATPSTLSGWGSNERRYVLCQMPGAEAGIRDGAVQRCPAMVVPAMPTHHVQRIGGNTIRNIDMIFECGCNLKIHGTYLATQLEYDWDVCKIHFKEFDSAPDIQAILAKSRDPLVLDTFTERDMHDATERLSLDGRD
jgi:hypothetical protein